MSGGQAFIQVLQVVAFLTVVWAAGRFMRHFNASPVVAWILVGIVMGPWGACVVPWAGCNEAGHHEDPDAFPNVFVLAGNVGVTLMIMVSGMHIQFDTMREVGLKALMVGSIGTLLPIAMTMFIVSVFFGYDAYPDALAAGVSMAPTSVGIAISLLSAAKQLNSEHGQVIITAAFIDDILSLLSLVVLISLAGGTVSFFSISWPALAACAFVGAGGAAAMLGIHKAIARVLVLLPRHSSRHSMQPRDELQLVLMLITLAGCGLVGMLIGSHLLGAFVAGLIFSKVPRSSIIWERQLKRVLAWLGRFFFAASVAFSVPVPDMLSLKAVAMGAALAAGGCVLPKIAAGLCIGPSRWVVGCAMVPRGEFAFFVAAMAIATPVSSLPGRNLLTNEVYAAVLWALVVSTFVAPFMFGRVLKWYSQKLRRPRSKSIGRDHAFTVRIQGKHRPGVMPEIVAVLRTLRLEVLEATIESDRHVDVLVFTVHPGSAVITDEKLREVRHEILDAVNDRDASVVFMGAEALNRTMLEIHLTCAHFSAHFHGIVCAIDKVGLEITHGQLTDHVATDVDETLDVDIVYAVSQDKSADRISTTARIGVKDALRQALKDADVRGEILVKHPKFSQIPAHLQPMRPDNRAFSNNLAQVTVRKQEGAEWRFQEVLKHIAEVLLKEAIDIMQADLETEDRALFYIVNDQGRKPVAVMSLKQALEAGLQGDKCTVEVAASVNSTIGALSPATMDRIATEAVLVRSASMRRNLNMPAEALSPRAGAGAGAGSKAGRLAANSRSTRSMRSVLSSRSRRSTASRSSYGSYTGSDSDLSQRDDGFDSDGGSSITDDDAAQGPHVGTEAGDAFDARANNKVHILSPIASLGRGTSTLSDIVDVTVVDDVGNILRVHNGGGGTPHSQPDVGTASTSVTVSSPLAAAAESASEPAVASTPTPQAGDSAV